MYDLVGNAWEWTDSFYIPYNKSLHILEDILKTFVAKGGSFIDTLEGETNHPIRVASR
jgi:formylglycine-generating enzyme required for sulfatase activity